MPHLLAEDILNYVGCHWWFCIGNSNENRQLKLVQVTFENNNEICFAKLLLDYMAFKDGKSHSLLLYLPTLDNFFYSPNTLSGKVWKKNHLHPCSIGFMVPNNEICFAKLLLDYMAFKDDKSHSLLLYLLTLENFFYSPNTLSCKAWKKDHLHPFSIGFMVPNTLWYLKDFPTIL